MNPSLSEALYDTVHRSKKPAKVISDETAIKYNYLMRMAMDTDSGCDFNLKYLVPVMKSADNYEVLKQLAKLCGFLVVKAPRGTKNGGKTDIHQYSRQFHHMMEKVMHHFEDPTEEKLKEVDQLLREHMSETENIRRRCKKNLLNQTEMFE